MWDYTLFHGAYWGSFQEKARNRIGRGQQPKGRGGHFWPKMTHIRRRRRPKLKRLMWHILAPQIPKILRDLGNLVKNFPILRKIEDFCFKIFKNSPKKLAAAQAMQTRFAKTWAFLNFRRPTAQWWISWKFAVWQNWMILAQSKKYFYLIGRRSYFPILWCGETWFSPTWNSCGVATAKSRHIA